MLKETMGTIPRMNGGGCLKSVTNTLQALPSMAIVVRDPAAKTLHLRYDPEQTAREQMKTALQHAGYPIEEERPFMQIEGETSAVRS